MCEAKIFLGLKFGEKNLVPPKFKGNSTPLGFGRRPNPRGVVQDLRGEILHQRRRRWLCRRRLILSGRVSFSELELIIFVGDDKHDQVKPVEQVSLWRTCETGLTWSCCDTAPHTIFAALAANAGRSPAYFAQQNAVRQQDLQAKRSESCCRTAGSQHQPVGEQPAGLWSPKMCLFGAGRRPALPQDLHLFARKLKKRSLSRSSRRNISAKRCEYPQRARRARSRKTYLHQKKNKIKI